METAPSFLSTNLSTDLTLENKQACIDFIQQLCDAFGPSGLEEEPAALLKESAPFCKSFTDSIGNVYLFPDQLEKACILLDAHMDEVGFMIQSINPNGTMNFLPLGGLNPTEVYGQKVIILTRKGTKIPAVCGTVPVHYSKSPTPDFDSLHFDAGFTSRQEAEEAGVEPGCFVVPDTVTKFLEESEVFRGKAFDDRIGIAAMSVVLHTLHQKNALQYTIAAGTVQEEVGERGASVLVSILERMEAKGELSMPQAAICFEGCPADDTFEPEEKIQSGLKRGPMIRARDRSMITHPKYLEFTRKIAREKKLPLQIAVRTGGGTNGGMYHLHNIPTIVIGIPVRYAHAAVGFCAWQDFKDAVQLAVEIVLALNTYFAGTIKEETHG